MFVQTAASTSVCLLNLNCYHCCCGIVQFICVILPFEQSTIELPSILYNSDTMPSLFSPSLGNTDVVLLDDGCGNLYPKPQVILNPFLAKLCGLIFVLPNVSFLLVPAHLQHHLRVA
jgi:hypothetical protein